MTRKRDGPPREGRKGKKNQVMLGRGGANKKKKKNGGVNPERGEVHYGGKKGSGGGSRIAKKGFRFSSKKRAVFRSPRGERNATKVQRMSALRGKGKKKKPSPGRVRKGVQLRAKKTNPHGKKKGGDHNGGLKEKKKRNHPPSKKKKKKKWNGTCTQKGKRSKLNRPVDDEKKPSLQGKGKRKTYGGAEKSSPIKGEKKCENAHSEGKKRGTTSDV